MLYKCFAHARANVVAYLALFVALSGSAYAAANLPKSSVGTKQLKDGAVTSPKIATKTRAELHGARGARGPQGPRGLQGAPGLSAKSFSASADGTFFENEDFKLAATNCSSTSGASVFVTIERKHDVAYDGSFINSPRASAAGELEQENESYGTGGLITSSSPRNYNYLIDSIHVNRLASGTFTVDSGGHMYSLQITVASGDPGCTIRGMVVSGS